MTDIQLSIASALGRYTYMELEGHMEINQGLPRVESVGAGMRSPLLEIPNELLQHIASLLPTDRDVGKLAMVCKEMNARVLAPESAVWRTRFADKYDVPKGRTSRELKLEYQTRAIVLSQKIDFKQEENEQQYSWLEVIQTMLTEVLALPSPRGNSSKTLEKIRETMAGVDFLSHPKRETPSSLFCAVQLCLTALALDPDITDCCLRTDYDIDAVYSYATEPHGPFLNQEALDLQTLLHMRSFWQRHLLNHHEGTFLESFSRLPEDLKPKLLKMGSSQASGLSSSWLGYYSCVHPLPDTLEKLQHRQTCADLDTHWDQVDILSLEFRNQSSDPFWPTECNQIIPQRGGVDIYRTYFDGVQKYHGGTSDAENPLFGFTEPITTPYGGFSGWTRICFAICEQPEDGADADSINPSHWLHGYEALIVPGGRLMLGRWLDLKDTSGRGPFIFWDL